MPTIVVEYSSPCSEVCLSIVWTGLPASNVVKVFSGFSFGGRASVPINFIAVFLDVSHSLYNTDHNPTMFWKFRLGPYTYLNKTNPKSAICYVFIPGTLSSY